MFKRTIGLALSLLLLLSLLPGGALAADGDSEKVSVSSRICLNKGLDLTGLTCYFSEKLHPGINEGAVGYLVYDCMVNGPADIYDLLISTWWDEIPDEAEIVKSAAGLIEIWKEDGALDYQEEMPLPFRNGGSRPVFDDELGKMQYTALIGLTASYEMCGYALVEADLRQITSNNREHTLPTATQYVPYKTAIPTSRTGSSFALTAGSLPSGLSLSSSGVISGIPTELGVFSFTVTETYAGGSTEHKCTLSVYSRMYADVEENNEPGYGFVETATDDGRVQDQVVSSAAELTDQVMHCQGAYPKFRNLYLDARRLIRDVEYSAEEGSTKITIYAETIGEEGGGTHTLAAEFETDEGETVYTVQNYTVAGIASREVHVEVSEEAVIWTDAEPYIDTNNRTMTPFRVVGEALGLTIAWDSAAREASFSDGTRTIYFPIESTTARTSEGAAITMDTSAVIVNGRTYAPVRYLAEFFGYSVGWDAPTRTVKIG